MNAFILRVCAYHGKPVAMNGNGVHARQGLSVDVPVSNVVNDPEGTETKDLTLPDRQQLSGYDLDTLIEDFQDEYGCKVNYDDKNVDGLRVFEFDVFEPAWPDDEEAKDVIDDLAERLQDWVKGYPTGR